MTRRVLVINGHPDGSPDRLCAALAAAYAEGARAAGHEVATLNIAALDVPYLRTQEDFMNGTAAPGLADAQRRIVEAEHVVFVFPLWLGTMPAMLKAFLEQVMRPGVAFAYGDNGMTKTLLKGRSARMVVTMGMPAFLYRFFFMSHGVAGLRRSILRFVGFSPVRTTLLGMAQGSADRRRKWLNEMQELGRRAA